MNPATDSYKNYCKTIVADLVRSLKTERVKIDIYDNAESYELFVNHTSKNNHDYSKEEIKRMLKYHNLAVYRGLTIFEGNVDEHELTYFPFCDSLFEKEIFYSIMKRGMSDYEGN